MTQRNAALSRKWVFTGSWRVWGTRGEEGGGIACRSSFVAVARRMSLSDLRIYTDVFETEFLEASDTFYSAEADAHVRSIRWRHYHCLYHCLS